MTEMGGCSPFSCRNMKTVSNDYTSVTLHSPFLLFAKYYMPQVQKVSTVAYHILAERVFHLKFLSTFVLVISMLSEFCS